MFNAPQQQHQSSGQNSLGQARQLIGRRVRINRGGPDSIEGILLAVNGDVLVLSSRGIIVYVNGRHVKSITEGTSGGRSRGKSGGSQGGRHSSSVGRSGMGRSSMGFIQASSFASLLSRLRQQFIQINRSGPERIEGFLAETGNDFILLVVGRELVRVPVFHIKTVNISTGSRGNESGSGNSGGNSSGDKNKQSGSKSGGNKSGGSKNRKNNRKRK